MWLREALGSYAGAGQAAVRYSRWVCLRHTRMALPHTLRPCLSSTTVQSMPKPCMQVPTDIIERNIKRASESKADYAEVSGTGQAAMTV